MNEASRSPRQRVDLNWRKSSHSTSNQCVEIAHESNAVLVRDSKSSDSAVLQFPRCNFAKFLDGLKDQRRA